MGRLRGDLSLLSVKDLLPWMINRKVSGLLTLEQGAIKKEVTIQEGTARLASSNDEREHFSQFLLHARLIDERRLQRAIATQKETSVLLGQILVMIGVVPEEQVIQTLRIKISETLLDSFRWRWGQFAFEEVPMLESRSFIEVAVPLAPIHREGVARDAMWDQFRRTFPTPGVRLEVDQAILRDLDLDSFETRIVELANEGLSMENMTLELHATDYWVASRLLRLMQAKVLRPTSVTSSPSEPTIAATEDPLSAAQSAMDAGRLGDALRFVRDGARLDPGNQKYAALRKEIEQRALLESGDLPFKSSIPSLRMNPDTQTLETMTARERYIIGRVDGDRSVQDILNLSPMHDLEAVSILRNLEELGYIDLG